jgi:hypothetical protein
MNHALRRVLCRHFRANMDHQKKTPTGNNSRHSAGNRQCDPSQKGGLAVCLQAHHAMVFSSLTSTFTGANPLS